MEGGDTPVRLPDMRPGEPMRSPAVNPEADLMEAVQVVGMADMLAEATTMEDIITAATAGTITGDMRQEGRYSELFWVE